MDVDPDIALNQLQRVIETLSPAGTDQASPDGTRFRSRTLEIRLRNDPDIRGSAGLAFFARNTGFAGTRPIRVAIDATFFPHQFFRSRPANDAPAPPGEAPNSILNRAFGALILTAHEVEHNTVNQRSEPGVIRAINPLRVGLGLPIRLNHAVWGARRTQFRGWSPTAPTGSIRAN